MSESVVAEGSRWSISQYPELVLIVHELLSIMTALLTRNFSLLSCLVNVFPHFIMALSSSLMFMEEREIAWK